MTKQIALRAFRMLFVNSFVSVQISRLQSSRPGRARARSVLAIATAFLLTSAFCASAWSQNLTPNWFQLSTANNPGTRVDSTLAYDELHGQVVLFGGSGEPNNTWLYNGTNWILAYPTTNPIARNSAAMAYDPAHKQVVLFGGTENATFGSLGDTWLWDGVNWTRASTTGPTPRSGSAMVYDAATSQVLLFGGVTSTGLDLNDTWVWNGTTWTMLTPVHSPSARANLSMAYDATHGKVILFGGSASGIAQSDTWLWNGTDWMQASPGTSPSARYSQGMSYSAALGEIVLFGGLNGNNLDDTWVWNGTNWAAAATPAGLTARPAPNGMTYDASLGQVILYSELSQNTSTWAWGLPKNFGSVNLCPVGHSTPAPCINTLTLTYNIATTTDFGTPKVVTQGTSGLDFTLASGSTCIGIVSSGSSCTVVVNFVPQAPGLRTGAVQLVDNNNNQLASTAIFGVGRGPAAAFGPGTQTVVNTTTNYPLSGPNGAAVDAAGNLYLSDNLNQRVVKVAANGTASTVGFNLQSPQGLAVDGAGDLYIADKILNQVLEVPAGCTSAGCQTTVGSGLGAQSGVAVDGPGNLYIGDFTGNQVVELPANGGAQTQVYNAGSGLHPAGLAVDAAGDLIVAVYADTAPGKVVEIPAGCPTSACQITLGTGWHEPEAVVVDAAGDLFVADETLGVVEVPAGCTASSCQIAISTIPAFGVAVDGAGNLLIPESTANQVLKFNRSQPASLSFATTNVGSISVDSPQSITIQNVGNQTLDAIAPGLIVNGPNFVEIAGSGTPADCTTTFALTPGGICNLSISFEPQSVANPLTGTAVFTDNALNATTATQTVSLSGIGLPTVYSISGTVTGLAGSGLVLQNNLGGNLAIGGNGLFTFTTALTAGSPYSVTVLTQPTTPFQSCTVTNGSGTVPAANIANVQVSCVTLPTFALTLTETGTGAGNLTDNFGEINCTQANGSATGSCSGSYPVGSTVTLTATASGTSTFIGWGGGCASSGTNPTCNLLINSAVNPTARFDQAPASPSNPLTLQNNYFVTGDYYSAGVTLRGNATGTITIPSNVQGGTLGVPDGADILAAYLYWETLENTPTATGGSGTFGQYSITGQQIGNDLSYTDGVSGTLRVYRADVNAYLPVGANGVRFASGAYSVTLPNSVGSTTGFPFTEGASLVVIYRVLSPNFPLKSVVIYDGSAAPSGATTQTVQGFYDAVGGANGTGENTLLFAGNGSWNNSTNTVPLGQSNQYTAQLNPGNAYAAVIVSTPVNNSDNDGILDAWKAGPAAGDFHAGQPGYYDTKTGSWVSLPGAKHGQKDLFVQLDYMCGAVLADGSCDPTQENLFPSPDALGNDPLAMVQKAFAATGIQLHLEVGNAIPEDTCTDNTSTNPAQLCQFPNQPGVIAWKNSLEFSKLWPRNLASCAAGGDCSIRFPYGQKDSYHYVLFGHSLAIPAWNTRYGTLVSIQVANGVTTIVTADRGTGINACPSRITLSGILGNPSLNGIYNTISCADTKTITVATPGISNWSYPNSTLPEPIIGLTSGTVTSISGYSDLGGADSTVTLGLWLTSPTQDMSKRANVEAGTLFHEIGHTLGLSHGGLYYDTPGGYLPTFEANCKPNYQSIMNYLFQLDLVGPNQSVAFSNQTLNTLNENTLSSVTQLTDSNGNPATFPTSAWYVPYTSGVSATPATMHCDGTPLNGESAYRVDAPIDPITPAWSNGQDINFIGVLQTQERGFNDWTNIDMRQVGAVGGEYASLATLLNFGSSSAPLNITAGGTVTLGSGGTVTLGSGGNVTLGSGGNVTLGSGGTITLGSGGNVTLGSGGNVTLGSGGTVTPGGNGNVTLGSGGNVTLGSGGTITLGSGGTVTLGSGGNVTLGSGGTIALGSGGSVTIGAGGSYSIDSNGGTITLGSGGNVTLGSGGNVTLGSGGTIALGSGGTVTLGSGGNVTLGSGGTVTLGSGGTVTLGSGGNVTLGSGGNVTLGSGGTVTLGSGGNVTLGSGGTVTLGSGGNVTLGSGGNVTLGSGGSATLGAGGTVTLGSGGTVTLGSGGNVTLGSGGTITLGSGGNVTLGSGGNVTLGSGGTVTLGSGGTVTLGSGGTVTLGSGGTVTLGSGDSQIPVSAGGTVTLGSGGTVTLGSGGNVTLGSGGNVTLGSGGTITLGSGGNVTLGSGGTVTLGSGGTITLGSGGNVTLGSGGTVTLGSGGNVTLGSGGVVALGSGGNVTLGSGGTITLGSGGNVTLGSGGNVTLGSGGADTSELTYETANAIVRPPSSPTETPTPTSVIVNWTAPAFGVVETYTIYRSSDGATPIEIGSVSGVNGNPPATTFVDTNPDLTSQTVLYTISTTLAPVQIDPTQRQSPPSVPAVLTNNQTISLGPLPSSVLLNGPQPTVTATALTSGVPNGLEVVFSATGSCSIGSQSITSGVSSATVVLNSTGSCVITASQPGATGYNAANSVSGIFTILPQGSTTQAQTINFPALPDVLYGSTFSLSASSSAGLPVSFTASGSCTASGMTTGVGTCMITASSAGNSTYSAASVTQSFTVFPAVLKVTANNLTSVYGQPIPTLTYSLSGYVNGDSASAVNGAPALLTTASAGSNAGNYPITVATGSLAATNYSFLYVTGTLTVQQANQAALVLTAASPLIYNQTETLSASGGSTNSTPTFTVTAGPCTITGIQLKATSGTGSCTVKATMAGNTNYTATSVSQSVTLAPTMLTVAANNLSTTVGAPIPTLTPNYNGFTNGDTTSALSGAPALSTTATTSSPVGLYPITVTRGTLSSANYTFSFVNGYIAVSTIVSPTLTTSATLSLVSGGYQAAVTVINSGKGAASNVQITAAALGAAAPATALPVNMGTIAPGGSASVLLTFPSSAGSPGSASTDKFTGTYTGGSFSSTSRVVLP